MPSTFSLIATASRQIGMFLVILTIVSAAIVAASPVPVFLAGGLRPGNVAAAVSAVSPFGVDVCSGLRGGEGVLDPVRLLDFVAALAKVGTDEGTP